MNIIERLKSDNVFLNKTVNKIYRDIKSYNFDYNKFRNDKIGEIDSELKEYFYIHFTPLNVADIIRIIVTKSIYTDKVFLHSKIIYEFIELLYSGKIPYCIMCKDAENMKLKNLRTTGDIFGFIKIYSKYIDQDSFDLIKLHIDSVQEEAKNDINRKSN